MTDSYHGDQQCELLEKVARLEGELQSYRSQNMFGRGVVAMARNTLPVAHLLAEKKWTLEQFKLWLLEVINTGDSTHLEPK